jgi:excisionase family DNA binding protein
VETVPFAGGAEAVMNETTSGNSGHGVRAEDPSLWLTVEEAAALLRVKVSWLYERTRTNEVPHLKIGKYLRFDRQELLAWTRQFRRDGGGRNPLRPKDRAR